MRIMFLNQAPREPGVSDEEVEETRRLIASYARPDTVIEAHFPDDYPGAIVHKIQGRAQRTCGLHHVMEAPGLVRKAVWAADNGFDAVIQSNTFDPGVEASRLAVRIPVIGLLRASLHVGAMLSDRIAIIAPLASDIPSLRRSISAYRMDHAVAHITSLGIYSDDLAARKDEILNETIAKIEGLKRDHGAECILPLGGKLIPYVVRPEDIERETGLPVLNTKAIGVRFAETCVDLGLTHAEAAYPYTDVAYEMFLKGVDGA